MIESVQSVDSASLSGYEVSRGCLSQRQHNVADRRSEALSQNPDLTLYLAETTEAHADLLMAKLISQHARPISSSIIRSKLRVSLHPTDMSQHNQEALEILSDVQLLLLSQLRTIKSRPHVGGITNFNSYVAATTYNACYRYLRLKYPMRSRLKNRIRYLLTHDEKFVFWQSSDRDWLCGLASWQNTPAMKTQTYYFANQVDMGQQDRLAAAIAEGETTPGRKVLAEVLKWAGAPVELNLLVTKIAELYSIKDDVGETGSDEQNAQRLAQLPDQCDVSTELEQRQYLQQLWSEICQLPLRQRFALLLNLRDAKGRGVVGLLPLTGVAGIRQIAQVLEMDAERFAALWNLLPLADSIIGEHIGATSQQVVNLRKCARQRLARRMKSS